MPFNVEKLVSKFGKHDLERLGLFIEMPYLREPAKKGKTVKIEPEIQGGFMTNPMKKKCGNQDGYFEKKYKRLHIGDKPKQIRRKEEKDEKKTKYAFIPAGPTKKQSTPDDYYGCFYTEPLEHFGTETRYVRKKKGPARRNPMTSPGKKGGPGVADITINPFPEYITNRPEPEPIIPVRERMKEEYRTRIKPFYLASPGGYFDDDPYYEGEFIKQKIYVPLEEKDKKKQKQQAPKRRKKKKNLIVFVPTGPHVLYDGYFEPFPEYKTNRYRRKYKQPPPVVKYKPPMLPATNLQAKTMQTKSVLQHTDLLMNCGNYKTYQPRYVQNL